MRKYNLLLTLMSLVSVCFVNHPAAQRRGIPIQVDYERPAGTWEEAAARSQVIAVVQLTGRRYVSEPSGNSSSPITVYKAAVVEIIRNAGPYQVAPIIEIGRIGGVKNTPEGPLIIDEAGFPQWFVGTKLLLFLTWDPRRAVFGTVGGPSAAFEIDAEGKARTFGKSTLAAKQNHRPFSELLAEVKERVR